MYSTAHIRKLLRRRVNLIAKLLKVKHLSIDVYLYKRETVPERNEGAHGAARSAQRAQL